MEFFLVQLYSSNQLRIWRLLVQNQANNKSLAIQFCLDSITKILEEDLILFMEVNVSRTGPALTGLFSRE